MAEFKEVMRQYNRMCHSCPRCEGCPFKELDLDTCDPSASFDEEELDVFETTVMEWARTHPEPVYPTIRELVNYIMNKIPGDSVSYETRIPADVAKEFNILPITKKEK